MIDRRSSNITYQVIKILSVVAVAFVAYYFISQASNARNQPKIESPTPTPAWYEGGTLHKVNVAEWRIATYENQLATAADFVVNYANYKNREFERINQVKQPAIDLIDCINTTIEDMNAIDHWEVADVATSCLLLMYP